MSVPDYQSFMLPGNEEWDKTFRGELGDHAQPTSDWGYIIAGTNISVSASMIEWWNKIFGGLIAASANSVQQTSDGGYITAGTTRSIFGSNVWLIKTDAYGNKLWDKNFPDLAGHDARGNSVRQTSDGGYIIVGTFGYNNGGNDDIWLMKPDENGNMQWDRTFGRADHEEGRSVQQTRDGGYIITGLNMYTANNKRKDSVWLIKTDTDGNKLWDKTIGGMSLYWGDSVQQTSEGGYVIAGGPVYNSSGNNDIWLIKTDANGN
jgi:hypothetical protein